MDSMGADAAAQLKQSPLYPPYAAAAPRPEDWPVLLSKVGDLVRRDYDWSAELASLRATTLIVAGDADAVRLSHVVEFYERIGGAKRDAGWDRSGLSRARLAILPGLTHYDIYSSPALALTATQFLDAAEPTHN
jgi:hypothetical protein